MLDRRGGDQPDAGARRSRGRRVRVVSGAAGCADPLGDRARSTLDLRFGAAALLTLSIEWNAPAAGRVPGGRADARLPRRLDGGGRMDLGPNGLDRAALADARRWRGGPHRALPRVIQRAAAARRSRADDPRGSALRGAAAGWLAGVSPPRRRAGRHPWPGRAGGLEITGGLLAAGEELGERSRTFGIERLEDHPAALAWSVDHLDDARVESKSAGHDQPDRFAVSEGDRGADEEELCARRELDVLECDVQRDAHP